MIIKTIAALEDKSTGWILKAVLVDGDENTVYRGRRVHERIPREGEKYVKVTVYKTAERQFVKTKAGTEYTIVNEL